MPTFKSRSNLNDLTQLLNDLKSLQTGRQQSAFIKRLALKNIRLMKELIARGKSPIRGQRDFSAYRGEYRKRIKAGKLKGKRLRPVNLELTGEFLNNLKLIRVSGSGYEIGFADKKSQDIEQGHRDGANGQAKRPIIPEANEQLKASINNALLEDVIRELEKKIDKL